MNKGLMWAGIGCLVLAAVLGVLILALPAGSVVMFNFDGKNRPWVGVAFVGIVGILLLVAARLSRQRSGTPPAKEQIVLDPEKAALNKRLESICWGCFLVMLGGFLLVPHTVVAKGIWSIGVGLIMLGLNAARYFYKIKMSGFTTFLGVISVVGGILQLAGIKEIEGAFLLIILGAFLLVKPWFDKRKVFGKAEES